MKLRKEVIIFVVSVVIGIAAFNLLEGVIIWFDAIPRIDFPEPITVISGKADYEIDGMLTFLGYWQSALSILCGYTFYKIAVDESSEGLKQLQLSGYIAICCTALFIPAYLLQAELIPLKSTLFTRVLGAALDLAVIAGVYCTWRIYKWKKSVLNGFKVWNCEIHEERHSQFVLVEAKSKNDAEKLITESRLYEIKTLGAINEYAGWLPLKNYRKSETNQICTRGITFK